MRYAKLNYSPKTLFLIFFIVVIVVSTTTMYLYYNRVKEITLEQNQTLSSISDYKINQIARWKYERIGDAQIIKRNKLISNDIKIFLEARSEYKSDIKSWLNSLVFSYNYENVYLLDLQGTVIISAIPAQRKSFTALNKWIDLVKKTHEVLFTGFYNNQEGFVRLGVISPVIVQNKLIALVYLVIDPEHFLYPLIQAWPTPSKTSESLLVQKDGDDVLFLNELRHIKNTALKLRIPLKNYKLPAAMAIKGYSGIVSGYDYRDMEVIANIRKIPNTNWFMVSKIDKDELYSPLKFQFYIYAIIATLILFTVSLILFLIVKTNQFKFAQKNYELEKEKHAIVAHYQKINKYANDLIVLTDLNNIIIEANERFVKYFGYELENVTGTDLSRIIADETKDIKRPESKGELYECSVINANNEETIVEFSSRLIKIEDIEYIQHIIRDVSERKKYEQKLLKANRLYSTLSQINQMIVNVKTRIELYNNTCEILTEYGKFNLVMLSLLDDSEKLSVFTKRYFVENSNEKKDLLDNLSETLSFAVELEFRELIEYHSSKQSFTTSHDELKSCISIIIKEENTVKGLLTVASFENTFFEEDEVKLMNEVALDLNHGLTNIALEEKRKEAERQLQYDEYCFEALYELSKKADMDEPALIQFALEEAVKMTSSKIGYFHFLHSDEKNLSLFAWSKSVSEECKAEKISHYPIEDAGVWADCVRLRRPVIHNDYNNLPDKQGLPTGHSKIVRHMSVPIMDGNKIVGIIGVGNKEKDYDKIDIRQSQLFMEEMWKIIKSKRSDFELDKLYKAINQSSTSIMITDVEGKIEYVNRALIDLTGYAYDEVIGNKSSIFRSENTSDLVYKGLWETVLSGKIWSGEIQTTKKNGELFWEFASVSPVTDKNNIKSFIWVKEDISEQKEMIDELIASKEEAEKSEKLKTEFLAQISHEIRTPLNVVINFAWLLKNELAEKIDDDLMVAIDGIEDSGKRIIRTIDLILNMSQIQTGTYNKILSEFDLGEEVIEPLVSQYKSVIKHKGVDINFSNKVSDTNIRADRYSITQVFCNLIDNAIKYTLKGSISINISEGINKAIGIEIVDTGIGISEEYLPQIFDTFSQEEHGYSRKYDGTGLGLSLVKEYCDLNNIAIEVESTKGVGTTFRLIIPRN